jgi:carboxypeptidase C (cathepsin A)
MHKLLLFLFVLLAWAVDAQAQPTRGELELLPSDSVTAHEMPVAGRSLAYSATAGTLPLFDPDGRRIAAVFYTAYVTPPDPAHPRPVTFAFNGGPGAASAYLHLGLVGPRRLRFGADGRDGTAPVLEDNPQTWLAFTDLVIIDPIGTGWSRTEKPDDGEHFWGVREDAEVMAKIVALWLARNARSASPKFLLGESYGGLRAAKVASALLQEQGVGIAGIIMISPLLDGGLTFNTGHSALAAALRFPSLAGTDRRRAGDGGPHAGLSGCDFVATRRPDRQRL